MEFEEDQLSSNKQLLSPFILCATELWSSSVLLKYHSIFSEVYFDGIHSNHSLDENTLTIKEFVLRS